MDPSVSAVVHYVRSLWFKHQKDFAEFYKASLLYLAFISSDALPPEQRLVCVWACMQLTSCPAGSANDGEVFAGRSRWRWTSRWPRCWATASTTLASCCCTPSCALPMLPLLLCGNLASPLNPTVPSCSMVGRSM